VKKPGISGVGCALLDILYPDARLDSDGFTKYRSKQPGDGGLVPGQLEFASALERYAGTSIEKVIHEVCSGGGSSSNVGGPAIVALIVAAQLLQSERIPVRYFGVRGDDEIGDTIFDIVSKTALDTRGFSRRHGPSPSTRVLSDPSAAGGQGERTFINDLGVAERFQVKDIPAEFFEYQLSFFGGTGLVPRLHEKLGEALYTARGLGNLTVVATVYDFLNESRAPDQLWPLGDGQRDYPLIDLLITDAEEARRLSGEAVPESAIRRFLDWGVGAAIITAGAGPIRFGASDRRENGRFAPIPVTSLPASTEVSRRAPEVDPSSRDTTGCGDNFSGGVLASIASQLATRGPGAGGTLTGKPKEDRLDLRSAVIEGIAAGAAAWFQLGGTRIESYPGETRARVAEFSAAYRAQIGEE